MITQNDLNIIIDNLEKIKEISNGLNDSISCNSQIELWPISIKRILNTSDLCNNCPLIIDKAVKYCPRLANIWSARNETILNKYKNMLDLLINEQLDSLFELL